MAKRNNGTPPTPQGRLVGYARVSTDDQNTDLQETKLREAGCSMIFVETASGAKSDRPELLRALDAVRPGDTLVVWKLDRLGRSLSSLIAILESLEKRGIGFRSLTETIDTTTPVGRAYVHLVALFAQFERDVIIERTRAGIRAARARREAAGGRYARPSRLNEKHLEAAEKLRSTGMPTGEIAKTLGVHRVTLYRAMKGLKRAS